MNLKDLNHEMQKDVRKKMGIPAASKYKNQRCEVDGMKFDSQREMTRFYELRLLERAGEIENLNRQVKFVIVEGVSYIADFTYNQSGSLVVEDSKGHRTKEYRIKKKLMKQILGIEIKET